MYTCQILRKLNEDIVPQVCEFHTNTVGSTQVLQLSRGDVHHCGRKKAAVEHK